MADETTTEAIAVSAAVVRALRAAGVLRVEEMPTSTASPPPPPPPLAVGDHIQVGPIAVVDKQVATKPSALMRIGLGVEEGITYDLDFPPNDARYLPELDRLFTLTKVLHVWASLEITSVSNAPTRYGAELKYLRVFGRIPGIRWGGLPG